MNTNHRTYNERDKALVYVTLASNAGNVKGTARETGIPYSTVKDWKIRWEKYGPPDLEILEQEQVSFVAKAEEVRDMALERMKQEIEHGEKVTLNHLATTVGILDDKLTRAKGLPTDRTEQTGPALPSGEDLAKMFEGFVRGIVASASERHEIIEAEVIEQAPKELGKGDK